MNFIKLLLVVMVCCSMGIAQADEWKDESGKGQSKGYYQDKDRQKDREKEWKKDGKERQTDWEDYYNGGSEKSYFQMQGYSRLDIPQGHYPPPGECRIWFPDRPAGHQPPPRKDCSQVPPGAWVIHHPEDDLDHVHVTAYEIDNPGSIIAVGEFEIDTGLFVRVILEY